MAELLLTVVGLAIAGLVVLLSKRKLRVVGVVIALALMSLPFLGHHYWWRPDAPYAHYYTEGSHAGMVLALGEMALGAVAFLTGVAILIGQLLAGFARRQADAPPRAANNALRVTAAVVVVLGLGVVAMQSGPFARADAQRLTADDRSLPITGSGLYGSREGLLPHAAQALHDDLVRTEVATGVQFAVLLLPGLRGKPPEAFAETHFQQWSSGTDVPDSRVLLVVSLRDRRAALAYGHRLDAALGDLPVVIDRNLHNALGEREPHQALADAIMAVREALQRGPAPAE